METAFDERLARVIKDRQSALRKQSESEDHLERDRRAAYERLTAELPRFLAKLSSAVLELNDRLSETDLRVTLKSFGHSPTAEATYELGVAHAGEDAPELSLAVDFSGKISASLRTRRARSLVRTSELHSIDRLEILNLLLTLLEAPRGG
jgi:hypothetical protein